MSERAVPSAEKISEVFFMCLYMARWLHVFGEPMPELNGRVTYYWRMPYCDRIVTWSRLNNVHTLCVNTHANPRCVQHMSWLHNKDGLVHIVKLSNDLTMIEAAYSIWNMFKDDRIKQLEGFDVGGVTTYADCL